MGIAFGVGVVATISIWLWLGAGGRDAALADDASKNAGPGAPNEVAYPPPYPSYPQEAVAAGPQTKSEFELCGYGPVDPEQLPAAVEAEADALILRVASELERGKDDRARALGLATHAWIAAHAADRRVRAEDPITCHETALCDERAAEAYSRAAQPSIDALVRLAGTTRDPNAYVTALRTCRTIVPDSPPTVCSALSLEQWAQVDPDNAFPWLLIARNANHRKDTAAFEDALRRASRARVFERRATQHGRILEDTDVRDEPVRALMVQKLALAESREDPADYYSNFTMFGQYCAKYAEPGRLEMCSDLATVLTDRSSDLLGPEIGLVIIHNTHWRRLTKPGEPVLSGTPPGYRSFTADARLARERAENLTCKASAQTEEWLRGMTKFGEVEYLRQRNANKETR
jgi:hypothetical protein